MTRSGRVGSRGDRVFDNPGQGPFQTFLRIAGQVPGNAYARARSMEVDAMSRPTHVMPICLAAVMAGACCLAVECDETRIDFRIRTRYLDAKAKTLDEALAMIDDWTSKGEAKSVGLLGNAADVFPELVARMKAAGDVGRADDAQHRRIVAHLPGAEAFAEVAVEVDLCGHLILRLLPMASRATSRVEAALARGMGEDRVRRRGARWISNGWKIF